MMVGIILSAGESKRMGTPKQLLPWGDTIVLQRIIDVAAASRLERVELILGHLADEIAGRITVPVKVRIVINEAYREGMASSVRCGVRNAPAEAEAYMLLLGDQPFVEGAVIDRLIDCHHAGSQGITIPVYNGRRGHPVIFSSRYRTELLAIGEGGAREVVRRHNDAIFELAVASDHILADMDTLQDYEKVKAQAGTEVLKQE
jgi:molybdenum cofactor cytidylyltransferase